MMEAQNTDPLVEVDTQILMDKDQREIASYLDDML